MCGEEDKQNVWSETSEEIFNNTDTDDEASRVFELNALFFLWPIN